MCTMACFRRPSDLGNNCVIVAGTAASDKYEKEVGREDPPEVVIDEVAGCWIACWGFDLSYAIVSLFS